MEASRADILLQKPVAIERKDTFFTLHDRLAEIGAVLLKDTLLKIKGRTIIPTPQDNSQATSAPSLKKEDGKIDWEKSAQEIFHLIRGMNPWPGTFTRWREKTLKIFTGHVLKSRSKERPGTICSATSEGIEVATGEGSLLITEIQLQDRRRMEAGEFIRGNKIIPGTILQ